MLGSIGGARKILKIIFRLTENLSIPLDRARRFVLRTPMERLEHALRRIAAGITRIRCELHLRIPQTVLVWVWAWYMSTHDYALKRLASVLLSYERYATPICVTTTHSVHAKKTKTAVSAIHWEFKWEARSRSFPCRWADLSISVSGFKTTTYKR